jgi:hypothetical protein
VTTGWAIWWKRSVSVRTRHPQNVTGRQASYRVLLTVKGRRIALEAIRRLAATHAAFFSPLAGETAPVVRYLQQLIQANELA